MNPELCPPQRAHPQPHWITLVGIQILFFCCVGWKPMDGGISGVRISTKNSRDLQLLSSTGKESWIHTNNPMAESKPSPDGQYVAALVLNRPQRPGALASTTLHVWSKVGPPIARLPNVHRFEFSPDSRYLAVIIGQPYEGALGFTPKRLEILALPSCTSMAVRGLESAREISWVKKSTFGMQLLAEVRDGNGHHRIVRYNPRNRQIYATNLKGLHCSPDGDYYILTAHEAEQAGMCRSKKAIEAGCFRIFTWNNTPVRIPSNIRVRRRVRWARQKGHELVITRRRRRMSRNRGMLRMQGSTSSNETIILDISNGSTRMVEDKPIDWSWQTRMGDIVTKESGRPRPRPLRTLKQRLLNRD